MARVEVDEADLRALQGVNNVVNQMMGNPDARKLVLQARKTADPKVVIPELDAAAPVNAEIGELKTMFGKLNDRLDAEAAQREQDGKISAFQRKWNDQKDALRQAGWRAAGVEAVEKFAEENGILDLSIAADAWEKRNPPAPPSPTRNGFGGLFGEKIDEKDTYIEDLMKTGGDDDARVDREIAATLADIRANR